MGDSAWCTAPDGTSPDEPIPYDLTAVGRALAERLRGAGLVLDETADDEPGAEIPGHDQPAQRTARA
jgi:hypothetical protein